MQNPPKKPLDQVRDAIRLKHYSYRIEETYVQWIVRYILFHNLNNRAIQSFPVLDIHALRSRSSEIARQAKT